MTTLNTFENITRCLHHLAAGQMGKIPACGQSVRPI